MNKNQMAGLAATIFFPLIKAEATSVNIPSSEGSPVEINAESAKTYGVNYEALQRTFSQFRGAHNDEAYMMRVYEEQGYINFSSFDGHSFNILLKDTPVGPNSLGGGRGD